MPTSPTARLACSLLVLLAPWDDARGQLRGGDLVAVDTGSRTIHRIDANGSVSPFYQGAPLATPAGIATTPQGEVLVADFAGALYRIDAHGTLATVASGLSGPIRVAVDRSGDYLVTELTAARVTRITPAGARTTVHAGAPLSRPFGIAVDPKDGATLVTDDLSRTLHRIPVGGAAAPLVSGLPLRLPQGVALATNGEYAVIDGLADSLFRVARDGSGVSTVVSSPPLGNPEGIVPDDEGGFFVCESGAPFGNRIVHVDGTGALSVFATSPSFSNLEDVARVPFLQGPPIGSAGTTNTYRLDFPQDALLIHAMFLAGDLYPGIALGARSSPLVVDALFTSFLGVNNALFVNFVGTLDATGRATAQLAVPNVPIPAGTRLHLQPVVVDLGAPDPLRRLGNLATVLF